MIHHAEIKRILPHRHPMLLVDAVLAFEPGTCITAVKNISRSEPCFDRMAQDLLAYAYPASLIIESFCQSAGILQVLSHREASPAGEVVMLFGSMSNVQFHNDAYAGETLIHDVRLETALSDAAVFSGEVRTHERLISTIERVVVAIRPATVVAGAGSAGEKRVDGAAASGESGPGDISGVSLVPRPSRDSGLIRPPMVAHGERPPTNSDARGDAYGR